MKGEVVYSQKGEKTQIPVLSGIKTLQNQIVFFQWLRIQIGPYTTVYKMKQKSIA